jgi:hypothetical protein
MESNKTATRLHPLMAAAAVSVVIVSLAGTAAITGLLPNSHATIAPAQSPLPPAAQLSAVTPAPLQMVAALPQQQYLDEPAPVIHKAPVVKHTAPRHVVHHTQVARNDYDRGYQSNYSSNNNANYNAPAVQQRAPAQPNYVGIGVGAVVGGLLGNQVGGGNGKKLATVAGVIGGGMLGNQIANGNR